eukprot:TRINITY_DN15658_c0_g1_i1.p1 TRINITY_DN15658_c0_g1~~TRINITY_DN15658_c0_g1_i1.p1  ORF type:complete len:345 (+),score=42.51 TRINITY_DN15658_c0_g1_i1:86-1120(+)
MYMIYLLQNNIDDRVATAFHTIQFLDRYDEMIPEVNSGRKFRFRKRFNGTRNIMDTIWEFTGTSSIKFSLDLQNWDFPAGTDRLAFDVQASWVSPIMEYDRVPTCSIQAWDEREISSLANNDVLTYCKGDLSELLVQSTLNYPNISLLLNFTSIQGNAFIEFPLGYYRDGNISDYLFPHGSNQWNFPIGRLAGMNYANRSSFLEPFLNLLKQADPLGEQQWTIFKTKMEMKQFSNAFYDPTVTLTSLFSDPAPAASPDFPLGTPGSTSSIEPNLGIVVGIPVVVAIVVAVGIALAFVLYRPLRQKVAPFSSRKSTPLENLDEEVESSPQQKWKASRGPPTGNYS